MQKIFSINSFSTLLINIPEVLDMLTLRKTHMWDNNVSGRTRLYGVGWGKPFPFSPIFTPQRSYRIHQGGFDRLKTYCKRGD
jgi:hypothetical protein